MVVAQRGAKDVGEESMNDADRLVEDEILLFAWALAWERGHLARICS